MEKCTLLRNLVTPNIRQFSTSSICNGQRNFRQLALYNFRGTRRCKALRNSGKDPDVPIYTYGVREPGYELNGKFNFVPEMVPELIVPDLTGFTLKPYVSYRASEVVQSEFTAKDLFDAIYSKKIHEDFSSGKLEENGNPQSPNQYERQTPEEARIKARQTGTDIF